MLCQDCGKKEADTIVFNDENKEFFCVCRDCIKSEDYILSDNLLNKFREEL